MGLYNIYTKLVHGKISHADAAEQLDITEKDLKFRITRYGTKLPRVLKTLDRIRTDDISREDAAHILGVTPRQVNNLMKTWKAPRPLKQYIIDKAIATVKWEIRKRYAIEFIAGSCELQEAADNAQVSHRQMRRWVADLLEKHYQIVFKDLKRINLSRRKAMADEIEDAEGLVIEKINVLNEVARGTKAIEQVALDRVLARRSHRGAHLVRENTER